MITTPMVSFLPTTAAQPTDVLRRDNAVREVVAPLKPMEAFHRERGLGSDSERRAQSQERSYAQQLAQARLEAGFPGFLRRSTSSPDNQVREEPVRPAQQRIGRDTSEPTWEDVDADDIADTEATRTDALSAAQQRAELHSAEREAVQLDFDWPSDPLNRAYSSSSYASRFDDGAGSRPVGMDAAVFARAQRIEQFYQGSFRPNEQFLLGVA
ncbi:hypothetical protein [Aliidiomarina maris]|uniref:Uncharacterized protein n=1 Tax=Aliidiomarina maris TaxID=531312 RepID=A0A327X2Q7_9GAMM|nr:hypothetical protein [Aliidiomarina maris]RAJ99173.1 hypothetical protein B0I24_103167 [Aliidiomarina maris]RUO27680.1 hypothetical protein CWE07_03415 [Aliidiomarina maris]